jgi:hypothetical protein
MQDEHYATGSPQPYNVLRDKAVPTTIRVFWPTVGAPATWQYFRKEHTIMNPFQRLWQWLKDRRVERHVFKDHAVGRRTPSQDALPLARGAARDAEAFRLRLRKSDPGPRVL